MSKSTPDEFMDYFRTNYPGPDTIISSPDWHAPKIYRAALHASGHAELLSVMELAGKALHSILGVAYVFSDNHPVCKECHAHGTMTDESTFAITHDGDCRTKAGIEAERSINAAIQKAKGL